MVVGNECLQHVGAWWNGEPALRYYKYATPEWGNLKSRWRSCLVGHLVAATGWLVFPQQERTMHWTKHVEKNAQRVQSGSEQYESPRAADDQGCADRQINVNEGGHEDSGIQGWHMGLQSTTIPDDQFLGNVKLFVIV